MVFVIRKKVFTALSGICLFLAVFPLIFMTTDWGAALFSALINTSIFLPLLLGILGCVFALLGLKGSMRVSLILLNGLSILLILFVLFIAFFGFKEP